MIIHSTHAMTSSVKQVEFALSLTLMILKTGELDVDVHWAEVDSFVKKVSDLSFLYIDTY